MTPAQNFSNLCERLGWTSPTYLAEKFEVSRKTIYNWRRRPPRSVILYMELCVRNLGL